MNIFSLSWKNIFAKPLNSFMSILLFALSVGLITFLTLFNDQFKKGLEHNLAGIDLVVGAKGSPLQLILSSMYHIDAPTGNIPLEEAAPFLNPAHPLLAQAVPLSLGDSYGAYRIIGATPSILTLYGAKEIEGEVFEQDFEVVIGRIVADKLHLHVGDKFFSTHGFEENADLAHDHGSPFVVSGILSMTHTVLDQLIICSPQTVWKVHDHDASVEEGHEDHAHDEEGLDGHDHGEESHDAHDHGDEPHAHISAPVQAIDTSYIATQTDSILRMLRASTDKEITSMLVRFKARTNIQSLNMLRNINQNTGLMAASPAIEINRLYAMMGSGADAISYIAILIAIVAAISIFISLYTSLKDRRYEMALMRVSGAGPGKLFQMIIGEGMWIAIIGLMLGLLLGHVGVTLAGNLLEKSYRYQFTGWIWQHEEIYIMIGALLIGLLASLIPAIQGSRIELHKTLAEN